MISSPLSSRVIFVLCSCKGIRFVCVLLLLLHEAESKEKKRRRNKWFICIIITNQNTISSLPYFLIENDTRLKEETMSIMFISFLSYFMANLSSFCSRSHCMSCMDGRRLGKMLVLCVPYILSRLYILIHSLICLILLLSFYSVPSEWYHKIVLLFVLHFI